MKSVLLALALAAGPVSADLVARKGANELRLMHGPCVHVATMIRIHPDHRKDFKKLQAVNAGKLFFGCWTLLREEGVVWVLIEDSPGFSLPLDAFKEEGT